MVVGLNNCSETGCNAKRDPHYDLNHNPQGPKYKFSENSQVLSHDFLFWLGQDLFEALDPVRIQGPALSRFKDKGGSKVSSGTAEWYRGRYGTDFDNLVIASPVKFGQYH